MNRKNKNFSFWALVIFVFIFFSCNNDIVVSENKDIKTDAWEIHDTIIINVPINNNNSFYDVYINIENKESFLTNNLWLFIQTKSPSGNVQTDTIMYFLTDEKGKWFGKKRGKIIKNKFLYKSNIKFPEKGIYKFFLLHGMRKSDLPEVVKAGIVVEKHISKN